MWYCKGFHAQVGKAVDEAWDISLGFPCIVVLLFKAVSFLLFFVVCGFVTIKFLGYLLRTVFCMCYSEAERKEKGCRKD